VGQFYGFTKNMIELCGWLNGLVPFY